MNKDNSYKNKMEKQIEENIERESASVVATQIKREVMKVVPGALQNVQKDLVKGGNY